MHLLKSFPGESTDNVQLLSQSSICKFAAVIFGLSNELYEMYILEGTNVSVGSNRAFDSF